MKCIIILIIALLLAEDPSIIASEDDTKEENTETISKSLSIRFGFTNEITKLRPNLTRSDKYGRNWLQLYMDWNIPKCEDLQLLFNGLPKDLIKNLINHPDKSGNTAFMRACTDTDYAPKFSKTDPYFDRIKMFCEAGAEINCRNLLGATPLHLMSRDMIVPNKSATNYLLANGANVNAVDIFGRTPIFKMRNPEIVKLLLDYGVDINIKDKCGRSAVEALMSYEKVEIIKLLYEYGAANNNKDMYGSTSLHYAAWFNSKAIAEIILENCRDLKNIQDDKGQTPEKLATELGNIDVSMLLCCHSHNEEHTFDKSIPYRSRKHSEIEYTEKIDLLRFISPPKDPNQFSTDVLICSGVGKPQNTEAFEIQKQVYSLVERILSIISSTDARFKSTLFAAGSASEGTKVGDPNEFDCVCCLETFSDICTIHEIDGFNKVGLAKLYLENKELLDSFHTFLNRDLSLNASCVYNMFVEMFRSVASQEISIWSNTELFFEGEIVDEKSKPPLNLIMYYVGRLYKYLKISVDIVPVLRKPGWWPKSFEINKMNMHVDMQEILMQGCFLLLQPPAAGTIYSDHELLRLSIAPAEMFVLKNLHDVLRDSYILAKSMCNYSVCPPICFSINDYEDNRGAGSVISSYMLKNALFHALEECSENVPQKNEKLTSDRRIHFTRIWALNIYKTLKKYTTSGFLPVFFLPEQNVFNFGVVFNTCTNLEQLQMELDEKNRRRLVFIQVIEALLQEKPRIEDDVELYDVIYSRGPI